MLIMGLGQEAWRCGYRAWAPWQGSGHACVGQRPMCRHTCMYTQCSGSTGACGLCSPRGQLQPGGGCAGEEPRSAEGARGTFRE